KLAFRHLLISENLITAKTIDAANLVPHIRVRKDKSDAFSKYTSIQNRTFLIDESSLSAKQDFLTIELYREEDFALYHDIQEENWQRSGSTSHVQENGSSSGRKSFSYLHVLFPTQFWIRCS